MNRSAIAELASSGALLSNGVKSSLAELSRSFSDISGVNRSFIRELASNRTLITNAISSAFIEMPSLTVINDICKEFSNVNIDNLTEICRSITDEAVLINSNGTIEASDRSFLVEDIECIINDCLEKSGFYANQISIQNSINNLTNMVYKLKESFLQKILIAVIVTIICNVIIMPVLKNIEKYFTKNNKEIAKLIKKEVNNTYSNKTILTHFRFVKAECLNVRNSSSIKSMVVGKLYFGQVVRIIYKNKNWTLIEYISENEEIHIKGWVFTRYLQKFTTQN